VDRDLCTSAPDVFAAGDCAQFRDDAQRDPADPAIEQLWYTGRKQGEVVGTLLAKRAFELANSKQAQRIEARPYERGVWFNSAKFFTIEYQTYGFVPARPENENTYVWVDEKRKQLLRLVWRNDPADPTRRIFTGINLFGMRFRHEICEAWIRAGRTIEYVVDHFKDAWFDPEFYTPVYKQVQKDFYKRERAA
jgi:NADPH-dependent 2,4-dienoyl-CoA reductase/sulfur reductase-like enzyme